MISLDKYRKYAKEIGGDAAVIIDELVQEIERLRNEESLSLLGAKEVAELIGIDRKNMHHTRKTKMFPEPYTIVGSRAMWREQDILDYMQKRDEWRSRSK